FAIVEGAHPLLADPAAVGVVVEVKANVLPPNRGIEGDRDVDQPEADAAFPVGTGHAPEGAPSPPGTEGARPFQRWTPGVGALSACTGARAWRMSGLPEGILDDASPPGSCGLRARPRRPARRLPPQLRGRGQGPRLGRAGEAARGPGEAGAGQAGHQVHPGPRGGDLRPGRGEEDLRLG